MVMGPSRPRFAELAEPPASNSQRLEFTEPEEDEGVSIVSASSDEWAADPATRMTEPPADAEHDLDVPAFMRRLQF
jgi:hypothetical protein